MDFGTALVDNCAAAVAQVTLQVILVAETIRAVHLDGLVGGLEGGLGGEFLGIRGLQGRALAEVLHPTDLPAQKARNFVILRHLGDFLLDKLVIANRFAKSHPLAGVSAAGRQRGADNAYCARRHGVASVVESRHGDFEALALLADAVFKRHAHILEGDPAGRTGAHTQFAMQVAARHAGAVQVNQEGGQALRGFGSRRIAAGRHQGVISQPGQRNPHLFTVQDVGIAIPAGGGLHGGHVRAHAGFGERTAADFGSAGDGRQQTPLLLLGAPLEEGHPTQPGMDGHCHAQDAIDRFEFLAGQAKREIVQALAAVTGRKADAEDAQFTHTFEHEGNRLLLAVVFLDDRGDFLLGEIAHHFLRHFVFGREGEVHAGIISKNLPNGR